jgi:uncharacterized protein YbjT (DUF2867 family)
MDQSPGELFAHSFDNAGDPQVAVEEQPEPQLMDRTRPVVVTGASGFVGTHTCSALAARGWKVRAVVRNTAKAAERLGHLRIEIRTGDIRDADEMRSVLRGAGSLVHLAAIAIEKKGESYEDTNAHATQILIDACRSEDVARVVYMSQNGADSGSRFDFLRSKGVAQDIVTASDRQWTVLRPSVIFGPEDEFVNVLGRLVRLSPIVYPLPGGGKARFQPIAVGNVAQSVVKCLDNPDTIGGIFSLGGAVPLTLRQIAERVLVAMNASRILVGVPLWLLRPVVQLAQNLLPKPPVTTSLLELLEMDNVVPSNDLTSGLHIEPAPFAPEELLYLRKITFSSAIHSMLR